MPLSQSRHQKKRISTKYYALLVLFAGVTEQHGGRLVVGAFAFGPSLVPLDGPPLRSLPWKKASYLTSPTTSIHSTNDSGDEESADSNPPDPSNPNDADDDSPFLESFRRAANAKLGTPIPSTPFETTAARQAEQEFRKAMRNAKQEFQSLQKETNTVDEAVERVLGRIRSEEDALEQLEQSLRKDERTSEEEDDESKNDFYQ